MPVGVGTGVAADYRFVITDLADVVLDEVPAQNPTWSYVLNDVGSCSFVLPVRHPKATRTLFKVGARRLYIYKGPTLVWGGDLWTAQGSAEEEVRFGFESWFGRLKRRYIDATKSYSTQDQAIVAWDLINFTQGQTDGNLGITQFAPGATTGVTISVNYPWWERANIGDAIVDLTDSSTGFDFDITVDKKFRVWYPSRGSLLATPFELGKNVQAMSILEDASNMATEVTAIGAGDGKATCVAVEVSVADRAIYGLLEASESFTDIKHFARLDDKAEAMLEKMKVPRTQPTLAWWGTDPDAYTVAPGDKAVLIAKDGWFDFNVTMRIVSVVFSLSNEGREAVSLNFDDGASL